MASIIDGMGNILFFYLLWHFGGYYYGLFFKNRRIAIKRANESLNKYRKKSFKTLDEQKEFLTRKYPFTPFNFNLNFIWSILKGMVKFIFFFLIFNRILFYLDITISIWVAIILWVTVPVLSGIILTKFKLENGDIGHLLRWK